MTKPTPEQIKAFAARSTTASFFLEGRVAETGSDMNDLVFMHRLWLRVATREGVGTFDVWLKEALADRRKILGSQVELDRYDQIKKNYDTVMEAT